MGVRAFGASYGGHPSISDDGSGNVVIAGGKSILLPDTSSLARQSDTNVKIVFAANQIQLRSATTRACYVNFSTLQPFNLSVQPMGGGIVLPDNYDITMGAGSQVLLDAGSVSLPAMAFAADTDTGIYDSGVSEMAFAVSGAQKGVVSASQWTFAEVVALSDKMKLGYYAGTVASGAGSTMDLANGSIQVWTAPGASRTLYLPLSPESGDFVWVLADYQTANNFTLNGNGNNIQLYNATAVASLTMSAGVGLVLAFDGAEWQEISGQGH